MKPSWLIASQAQQAAKCCCDMTHCKSSSKLGGIQSYNTVRVKPPVEPPPVNCHDTHGKKATLLRQGTASWETSPMPLIVSASHEAILTDITASHKNSKLKTLLRHASLKIFIQARRYPNWGKLDTNWGGLDFERAVLMCPRAPPKRKCLPLDLCGYL